MTYAAPPTSTMWFHNIPYANSPIAKPVLPLAVKAAAAPSRFSREAIVQLEVGEGAVRNRFRPDGRPLSGGRLALRRETRPWLAAA
jgi:hypothetical protein